MSAQAELGYQHQLKHWYTGTASKAALTSTGSQAILVSTGTQAALVSTGSQAPLGNPTLEALASRIQTPCLKTQRLFGLTLCKEKLKYEARASGYGCPSRAWVPAHDTSITLEHWFPSSAWEPYPGSSSFPNLINTHRGSLCLEAATASSINKALTL